VGQVRKWFKKGIDDLPYETVRRIEELSDVDMRLLVERGRHATPTAFADGTTCGTPAIEALRRKRPEPTRRL
jgi:hypothetical protein